VVLFPLGVGEGRSPAATPTLGSLLIDLVPSQREALTVLLVAAMLAIVVALLVTGVGSAMPEACFRAAAAFVAVFALAPAARIGYLAYPASFAAWGVAFRSADARSGLLAERTDPFTDEEPGDDQHRHGVGGLPSD
jgi:phosphatidylinositol alpha-1,6-mannosyltransferase